jgi:hypothetical protein
MRNVCAPALLLVVLFGAPGATLVAQDVISAQAGLVNFVEGPVLLNGREALPARGLFPQMKEQDMLRTTGSRAELLLSPGVFLRLGPESSIRLVSGKITHSKIELLTGTIVLEAAQISKDTAVTLMVRNASVSILKRGFYRIGTTPAELKVFDGKAKVVTDHQTIELDRGRSLTLAANAVVAKFDSKRLDPFDEWNIRRAAHLSSANWSTAQRLRRRGPNGRCTGRCVDAFYGQVLRSTYDALMGGSSLP